MTAPGSTARQIFNTSSTLLDSSTDLDALQAHAVRLDRLDSYSTAT